MRTRALSLFLLAGAALLAVPASAVTIDWVPVGDAGNAPDTATNCFAANCGSVPYEYSIAKYEVTNAQYTEFLNAKAASDPLGLYSQFMAGTIAGGINRSGSDGSYTYTPRPGFENRPVIFISYFDTLRFANWMHNGQGNGDTETGSYTLLGGTATPSNGATVTRNPGATIVLPSENEWYKAAFYDAATTTYFDWPAGTDAPTVCASPGATPNTANCVFTTNLNVLPVGSFTNSASPYGTFDQGGNVEEWNEEIVGAGLRGLRGGQWTDSVDLLAASARSSSTDLIETFSSGFRVAMVPEPGTTGLLMAGFAGLVWKRRS
jgi:formylglycine-generating enzyme required for sulfatase activity